MSDAETEVRAAVDSLTEALQQRDAQKLESLLSNRPGSMNIGSDPDEWWTKAELVAGIRQAMQAGASDVGVEHDEVTVHAQGDVAWFEGKGKFTDGKGGERGTRFTGVFVREDDRWKATQIHASVGVPNDHMFDS